MKPHPFMAALNDAIPEYREWKECPLPSAIFAIESLRHTIELTRVYFDNFIKHGNQHPEFEKQLALYWRSNVKSVLHIDKRLMSLCKDSRSGLLRADDWIRSVKEGVETDFDTPYKKLGVLLNSAKGQATRQRNN